MQERDLKALSLKAIPSSREDSKDGNGDEDEEGDDGRLQESHGPIQTLGVEAMESFAEHSVANLGGGVSAMPSVSLIGVPISLGPETPTLGQLPRVSIMASSGSSHGELNDNLSSLFAEQVAGQQQDMRLLAGTTASVLHSM